LFLKRCCCFFGRNDAEETGYRGVNYAGGRTGGYGYGYLGMVSAGGGDQRWRSHSALSLVSSAITVVALGCLHLL
jgi:pectate lyase